MAEPVSVSAPEPGKKTSKIVGPMDGQDTVQLDAENAKCYWNGQEFSKGDRVSHDGSCHECSFGLWVEVE